MKGNRRTLKNWLGWRLCFLAALSFNISAQTEAVPTELNIVVLEGEGAVNHIRQRVTPEPKIRVEDEAHKPLSGAAVVFTLPTEGATGEFGNGSKTLVLSTDSNGQATAQGLRMNDIPGKIP